MVGDYGEINMNYPVWDVPIIGSGWVIGGIAIFHILISHFAIGGGLYLPLAERKALKEKREDWMEVVHGHAKFFLILTMVFGTISGVAIWFSIGLANPEATSTLIHNFVFGWAIEWVFFLVEISAALIYYYTWNKVDPKTHLKIGYVYFVSAFMSLVVINGILSFMLTPGETWLSIAGTGAESSKFWYAFFNPTYWPSLFLRTLVCVSLAGIWALVTASRIDGFKKPELKKEVVRWSAKWLIPSFILFPICFFWYLAMVPETQKELLQLGISTIGQGTFTQVTRVSLITIMSSATILAIVYFLAWKNPRDFTFGHACAVLFLALAATGATEYGRETLRKPFVVGNHMYSNGVRVADVQKYKDNGYLTDTIWASPDEKISWKKMDIAGPVSEESKEIWTSQEKEVHLVRGELMFRGQCMSCHTVSGYRPMEDLLHGRNKESIKSFLNILYEFSEDSTYRSYMPPLVGTPNEKEALADFLNEVIVNPPKEKKH